MMLETRFRLPNISFAITRKNNPSSLSDIINTSRSTHPLLRTRAVLHLFFILARCAL
jgi:hypothetical protein